MIFRTSGGRTLWQRVLYWVEEKANEVQRELRHERKEREQRHEVRHKPYYDTFRSWADELLKRHNEKDGDYFHLFTDPNRCVHGAHVANYDGRGCFPAGQTFIVKRLSATVTASDEVLAERVRSETYVGLFIGNAEYLEYVLGDAERSPALERDIPITPLQNYYVILRFSPDVTVRLRELKTKVGPGAGWVSIRVTLDGILRREVL